MLLRHVIELSGTTSNIQQAFHLFIRQLMVVNVLLEVGDRKLLTRDLYVGQSLGHQTESVMTRTAPLGSTVFLSGSCPPLSLPTL